MSIISANLSPNTEHDDVWRAVFSLLTPWKWKQGRSIRLVEQWFCKNYRTDTSISFSSGRVALYALLRAFDIGSGDEVIVQAFTCVAVPNSVLWCGAIPVYADIDDSYNINPDGLLRLVTKYTKAIIVQHTFGIAANMSVICEFAKKHNLLLIEDCAHGLGGTHKGKALGTFGDGAFFSFGRDKILSSVWGGLAIIHSTQNSIVKKALRDYHDTLPMSGNAWIVQQLFHPVLFSLILPLYTCGIGKVILFVAQKLRLLSFPVVRLELQGSMPKEIVARYPNALAELLVHQLAKLSRFTRNRQEVAQYYVDSLKKIGIKTEFVEGAGYLRFPLQILNSKAMLDKAKRRGILLGNWYRHVIDPVGVRKTSIKYFEKSCPNAERASASIINLPTRISQMQARAIVQLFTKS